MRDRPNLSVAVLCSIGLLAGCAGSKDIPPPEPTDEEKIARIIQAEDAREPSIGELVSRLADASPIVRARAALALGRIGRLTATEPLGRVLAADASGHARASAAFALGLVEGDLPPGPAASLQAALDDPSEEVRARAAEALGRRMGIQAAEPIVRAASSWLPPDSPPYAWREPNDSSAIIEPRADLRRSLFTLATLGSPADTSERVRWLFSLATDDNGAARFNWWPAVWAEARVGAPELAPLFYPRLTSIDPDLRMWATRGLSTSKASNAPEWLPRLLADPNEKVRIEAIRGVTRLGLSDEVPRLLSLLDADTPYVQAEVLKAHAVLPHPDALEPVLDRLSDESPWMRALSLPALLKQDPDSFWLILSGLGDHLSWWERKSLIETLGTMTGQRATSLLERLANEQDDRVRTAALSALSQVGGDAYTELFVERLSAESVFERAAAAEALGKTGSLEAAPVLSDAFAEDVTRNPEFRLAALDALAQFGEGYVNPAAQQALSDPAWLVRRRGAAILGVPLSELTGPSLDDRRLDYIALADPPFTPEAYIHTDRGTIKMELFVQDAPMTVDNFVRLASEGFYDEMAIHRVVPNFVVQAGDPRGDSRGGPGFHIRCEINRRAFLRGTVGMALSGKDSGGSQFFITHLPQPHLDGRYTVFGQVVEGMDVVDRLVPGDTISRIAIWDGFRWSGEPATSQSR